VLDTAHGEEPGHSAEEVSILVGQDRASLGAPVQDCPAWAVVHFDVAR
jgi:hypothetical protein